MSAASRILGRLAGLAPATTGRVAVERDLVMQASDGVTLLADHWWPDDGSAVERLPIVLLRSPYGRRRLSPVARLFAERGYQVVVQSCRGTFGSGGRMEPFRNEAADGRETFAWLAAQPWWSGRVGTFGPSYLGLTQWAVAADPPPGLHAMALDVTASRFRDAVVYPGGTFALETGANWVYLVEHQELALLQAVAARARAGRRIPPAYTTLPLSGAERAVVGRTIDFYQDWLEHERPGDPWWDPVDFGRDLARVPPATLLGGWHDIFLPAQVDDYTALVAAGRDARLTIGPWTHASLAAVGAGVSDALEWFDAHLKGLGHRRRRHPVRVWLMGADRWVDLPSWPPPARPVRWHLHREGRLSPKPPQPSPPDRYRWDPADPTPGCGGPSLDAARAGSRDQAPREQRADVVCFTTDPLAAGLTVAGPLSAEVWLRSSNWYTDLFVRLCTVTPEGRSLNISDGIVRIEPDGDALTHPGTSGDVTRQPDGSARVRIRMWPTALRLPAGHRLRLQVSAGAHPLFARNPGGGERLRSGATLVPADHEILHDPDHPSAIVLPHAAL